MERTRGVREGAPVRDPAKALGAVRGRCGGERAKQSAGEVEDNHGRRTRGEARGVRVGVETSERRGDAQSGWERSDRV